MKNKTVACSFDPFVYHEIHDNNRYCTSTHHRFWAVGSDNRTADSVSSSPVAISHSHRQFATATGPPWAVFLFGPLCVNDPLIVSFQINGGEHMIYLMLLTYLIQRFHRHFWIRERFLYPKV
jgi:hypothetical protein